LVARGCSTKFDYHLRALGLLPGPPQCPPEFK
jgi:hypothetical protein